MYFKPSFPVQSSYLGVTGPTKTPLAQHKEITRIYRPIYLKGNFRKVPFKKYQTRILSHNKWKKIPETYCFRKDNVFVMVIGSLDISVSQSMLEPCSSRAGIRYLSVGISTSLLIILKNITSRFFVHIASNLSLPDDPVVRH